MVVPAKVKNLDTLSFCKLMDVDVAEFEDNFDKAMLTRYRPSPIGRNISIAEYGRLQERLFEFKGFFVQSRPSRTYPKAAAHALGYLGEVNDKDIENSGGYYHMGDYIGSSGLEKSYEEDLRGQKGV